jgi:hypothetical protein
MFYSVVKPPRPSLVRIDDLDAGPFTAAGLSPATSGCRAAMVITAEQREQGIRNQRRKDSQCGRCGFTLRGDRTR